MTAVVAYLPLHPEDPSPLDLGPPGTTVHARPKQRGSNGLALNGVGPNGVDPKHHGPNGIDPKQRGANGLAPTACRCPAPSACVCSQRRPTKSA